MTQETLTLVLQLFSSLTANMTCIYYTSRWTAYTTCLSTLNSTFVIKWRLRFEFNCQTSLYLVQTIHSLSRCMYSMQDTIQIFCPKGLHFFSPHCFCCLVCLWYFSVSFFFLSSYVCGFDLMGLRLEVCYFTYWFLFVFFVKGWGRFFRGGGGGDIFGGGVGVGGEVERWGRRFYLILEHIFEQVWHSNLMSINYSKSKCPENYDKPQKLCHYYFTFW